MIHRVVTPIALCVRLSDKSAEDKLSSLIFNATGDLDFKSFLQGFIFEILFFYKA